MTIYDLNYEKMTEVIKKFMKTLYGKTVFLLAYSLFIISFIGLFVILYMMSKCLCYMYFVFPMFLFDLVLTLISFILGSKYFYKELKEFVKEKIKER